MNGTDLPTDAPAGSQPALFRWYPRLRDRLAWVSLGRFPTPVAPLQVDPIPGPLFVKRDDLAGGVYGGNKVRKLEFILGEAKRQGAERLITAGAAGSHHALATAVYGRSLGFRVTLVLFPQPLTPHVREVLLLHHAYGAEIRFVPRMEAVPLGMVAARVAHRRERCFVIPPGGSDPLGTLGYLSAALELVEQVRAGTLPPPASIHLAAGTLGTATGLALGLAIGGSAAEVSGTRITSRIVANQRSFRRLAERTVELLRQHGIDGIDSRGALDRFRLGHAQIGRGYGHPTPDGIRATEVLAEAGLHLDPTYTAKAAVDFLDRAQYDDDRSARLFWHTLSAAVPPPPANAPDPVSLPRAVQRYLDGPW